VFRPPEQARNVLPEQARDVLWEQARMSVGASMKARIVLVVSAVAITMLAAGCSRGASVAAPKLKLEKTSIVVDAFPAIDSAGLYIAKMDGLFTAEGLQVTLVPENGPPP